MPGFFSKKNSCQEEFGWLQQIGVHISSHDCSSSWEVIRTALAVAIGSDSDAAKAASSAVKSLCFVPPTPDNFVEVDSFDKETQVLNMEHVIDSNGKQSRTIDKYVQQETPTEEIRKDILSQLVSILTAIHHAKMTHNDLHSENILVRQNQDGSINLVVIDPNFEDRKQKTDVNEVALLILTYLFAYGDTRKCQCPCPNKRRKIYELKDRPEILSLNLY